MITKMLNFFISVSIATSVVFAADGVRFNVIDGDADKDYIHMLESSLESSGFVLSDPHEHINDAYKEKYGTPGQPEYDKDFKITLDNLGFFTLSNDKKLNALLKKAPQLGGFSPFNLHIYKKANEDKTYIGHIVPSTMLDIVGVKDKSIRKEFISMFDGLDKLVQDKLGGKVEISKYDKLPVKKMMTFEYEFDKPAKISEFTEEFQEAFEAAFEDKDYIIAGFKNFKEAYTDLDMDFSEYDAYWTYSLCHFPYSYNIFNKGRPDAGVFAPCSMYMYIKKGTNKLVIGMPLLSVWASVMNIEEDPKNKWIKSLDEEITSLMLDLGAKEI